MQPGSFIDLLMRAKDKTTGQGFTDMEIANQVSFHKRPRPVFLCQDRLPQHCSRTLLRAICVPIRGLTRLRRDLDVGQPFCPRLWRRY